MKEIPGFDIELAQAIDYILGSPLAKRAFVCPPFYNFTNIVTEIIRWIDRLADNCHMPELTNHALPHICSIVKRASEWGESDGWLEEAAPQEAGYLLTALLIHDIGMLSQDSQDVPEDEKLQNMKGLSDVSGWVRRTHVIRTEGLVKNFLKDYMEDQTLSDHLDVIIGMARSHAKWPWEPDFVTGKDTIAAAELKEERIGAFNAVIAVCDLLDEDSDRCDTLTLIKHRYGTAENKAHWFRHALTRHVEGVKNHRIAVCFRRLPSEDPRLDILYRTLRNHYRLVKLYQEKLAVIHGEIQHLDFEPGDGIPEEEDEISRELGCYHDIPELRYDIIPHLMATFMKEARNQDGGNKEVRKRLDGIGLETIDMSEMDDFFHPGALLYPEERVLFGKGTVNEKLTYAYDLAEKAYVNGEIEKLRHICGAVLEIPEAYSVKREQIYWAVTYLLIYEKGGMDFEAAEGMHRNQLFSASRNCSVSIPAAIPSADPYQGLLDVLFCFLKPYSTPEAIRIYRDYLMEYDYTNLRDDFATLQLARTVIGLFWFWDGRSEVWREISERIRGQVKKDRLAHMLEMQQKSLELQYKILYGSGELTEAELTDTDYPVLAKAWKHFFQADWESAAKDIRRMLECAEKNPDLFGSVQGYQNMTYSIIECSGIDRDSEIANYRKTGIRRYQRNSGEQERSEFWQSRESIIETSLAKNRTEPNDGNAAAIRASVIRLISLRKLEALQYWNIGEYLEAVRNEAGWFYDLAVYEDKYGVYQGTAGYLPEAVNAFIQGLDSKQITKEEMRQVAAKIYYHFPEGYEEIVRFLTATPQKCAWSYGVQWLEYFIMDLNPGQLSRVLEWLAVSYDAFIRTQKHRFNLGEYEFLWQAAHRFSENDWNTLYPIIKKMYQNYFLYNSNKKFVRKSFQYMPLPLCEKILEMIEGWPPEQVKRNVIYESCIGLSKKWGGEINARLHRLICSCQAEDPCRLYQDLDELIDVGSLLERQDIDTEGICRAVKEAIGKLKSADLSGYNSLFFQELKEKFTNQNWRLMPEEKVFGIIRAFFELLKSHGEMSKGYFSDICELFGEIARMAEENVKREIAVFFVERYIVPGAETGAAAEYPGYADGPLNSFHFDLFADRKWEQDVFLVLVNCITEIPGQYREPCIRWAWKCLEEDRGVLYYYAVLLISYYYFTETGELQKTAFCGFLYIRGRLEARGRYFESQLWNVLLARRNLEAADQWFGGMQFARMAEQDKDYQEIFQGPIQALRKKSGNPEIRHWGEEQGMEAVKQS